MGVEQGKVQSESVGAAAVLGQLAVRGLSRVMEEAESLSAKSGRTTKRTIGHAMVAGRAGHGCLQKTRLFAWRKAKRD